MVALRWIISSALAASTALANDFAPAGVFIHPILAKRQNESAGSPSYNCHDNCGRSSSQFNYMIPQSTHIRTHTVTHPIQARQ